MTFSLSWKLKGEKRAGPACASDVEIGAPIIVAIKKITPIDLISFMISLTKKVCQEKSNYSGRLT
jgi:hypothetical protein